MDCVATTRDHLTNRLTDNRSLGSEITELLEEIKIYWWKFYGKFSEKQIEDFDKYRHDTIGASTKLRENVNQVYEIHSTHDDY